MKALLLMGCPQLPVQTAAVLYIANRLNIEGFEVLAAGNKAALGLVRGSDPEKNYIKKMIELDRCIADLSEKKIEVDLSFIFIHNDSGIVYMETARSLTGSKIISIIFGNNIEPLIDACGDSTIIAAKAVHNFTQLRAKIDGVKSWAALMK